MNRYEAMFILKPDMPEEERKTIFNQIAEAVTKNSGTVNEANIWLEKRKLNFKIKRQTDALYYLMSFTSPSAAIDKIRYAYRLNEGILRVMITRLS